MFNSDCNLPNFSNAHRNNFHFREINFPPCQKSYYTTLLNPTISDGVPFFSNDEFDAIDALLQLKKHLPTNLKNTSNLERSNIKQKKRVTLTIKKHNLNSKNLHPSVEKMIKLGKKCLNIDCPFNPPPRFIFSTELCYPCHRKYKRGAKIGKFCES